MMLASCSSNDKLDTSPTPQQPEVAAAEIPVGFDAYTQRGVTRAGTPGELVTSGAAAGQINLQDVGFGVFGYYTDLNEYDQLYTPNFMYNQKVSTAAWTYDPVKYWPNEYGTSAISDDTDKMSFFAYAPWVDVTAASGKVDANENTWGITGMTKNSATGDPIIKYVSSFDPAKTVDLCWGVVGTAGDGTWNKVNGGTQNLEVGMPWINVERPVDATGTQKMKFTFLHALAQLDVDVDAAVNELNSTDGVAVDPKTKIYVRSISFTGIAQKGALNLNNTNPNKALWLNYNGTDELDSGDAMTVYDGLKDGKEGTGQVATNEKSLGLYSEIISNSGNTTPGVTKAAQQMFENGVAHVIPSGEKMTVTIAYDVETADDNLAGYLSDGVTHGSSIQNVISKEVHFGTNDYLENGKKYILHLHLGMNSVKFDAAVTEWDPTPIHRDVELPFNALSFASGASGTLNAIAAGGNIVYYITGMDRGGTATAVSCDGTVVTANVVTDGSKLATYGYASYTATVAANTKTKNQSGSIKVSDGTTQTSITVSQDACALGWTPAALAAADTSIDIASHVTGIVTDWSGASISITKNGAALVLATDYTVTAGVITLTTAAASNDVYKVTVQVEDADSETQEITVP